MASPFCTACGATVADGTRFCVKCGQPVGEAATSPGAQTTIYNPPSPPPARTGNSSGMDATTSASSAGRSALCSTRSARAADARKRGSRRGTLDRYLRHPFAAWWRGIVVLHDARIGGTPCRIERSGGHDYA